MKLRNKLISIISSVLVLNLLFTGCNEIIDKNVSSKSIIEEKVNPENLNIEGIMRELTSDEYLSRVVGTDENTKSAEFIKDYFEELN